MNTAATRLPPFFEWRGKRVITLTQIDKLHGLKRGKAAEIFCRYKSWFVTGRDAYLISGTEAYDELPVGITSYWTNNLWLLTESGYERLSQIIKEVKPRSACRGKRR